MLDPLGVLSLHVLSVLPAAQYATFLSKVFDLVATGKSVLIFQLQVAKCDLYNLGPGLRRTVAEG